MGSAIAPEQDPPFDAGPSGFVKLGAHDPVAITTTRKHRNGKFAEDEIHSWPGSSTRRSRLLLHWFPTSIRIELSH